MPIYGEGSSVWKELEALKDIVLNSKYRHMYRDETEETEPSDDPYSNGRMFELAEGTTDHSHLISLSPIQAQELFEGQKIPVTTEESGGHTHELYIVCFDKERQKCFTRGPMVPLEPHGKSLINVSNPEDDSDL